MAPPEFSTACEEGPRSVFGQAGEPGCWPGWVPCPMVIFARKVIILDLGTVSAQELLAIAAVVLALGVTHWLVGMHD
jgi:hypothetical protein